MSQGSAGAPGPRELPDYRRRRLVAAVALNAVLIIVAAGFAAPFYWMVISSIRPLSETIAFPVQVLPGHVTFDNFIRLLTQTNFGRTLVNSVIIAAVVSAGAALFCSMAGYALAHLRFRGRQLLFFLVIATMLLPATVQLVPNFYVLSNLGLLNTWWALILPSVAPAIGIFWMRQYIRATLNPEVLDAARMDGASEYRIFWQVVLPLSIPGVSALAVFVAVQSWNEFVLPFIYLQDPDSLTFPPRLIQFFPNAGQLTRPYDLIMAGAVLGAIPMVILFLRFQRYFVPALTWRSDE